RRGKLTRTVIVCRRSKPTRNNVRLTIWLDRLACRKLCQNRLAAPSVLVCRIRQTNTENGRKPIRCSATEGAPMVGAVDAAKQVLSADEAVLYGIFGIIGNSGYFPPREFLNEFLMVGSDPCDQDGRMGRWKPFALSPGEYDEVKAWWV